MKELSIEEKAKRYDEAIKVAKRNYETIVKMDNDCTFAKEGIVNTFHHMFPELKEGDDERIRKEIINHFKEIANRNEQSWITLDIPCILAWLEKQGKLVEYYEDKLDRCACKSFDKGYKAALEKKSEQKPTVWSDEDEVALGDALWCCKQAASIAKDENDMGNVWCAEHWFKSLKDRYTWKPSDEQMKAVKEAACYSSVFSGKTIDNLISLSKQLKKLRGE